MSVNNFSYNNFFSNPGILIDYFSGLERIWNAVSGIDDFIKDFEKVYKKFNYEKLSEKVYIGENVKIEETAKIDGSAIIGHNSSLGHAAYLRSGVILGDNVHVGHATEVKHSIILSDTALAHLNYVGDSIMGSSINLSGGATLANWRFDKKDVVIKLKEEKFETGMEKFGSIIGDNCFIGVNAVLNPGTVLAKGSLVFPLISVKGAHLTKEVFK